MTGRTPPRPQKEEEVEAAARAAHQTFRNSAPHSYARVDWDRVKAALNPPDLSRESAALFGIVAEDAKNMQVMW